jgi:hypothetical protein
MAKKKAAPKGTSKGKGGGADDFDKFANDAEYKKAWNEKRKTDAGDSFDQPVWEDGNHTCRVTGAKVGVVKAKGDKPAFPYLVIDCVCVKGEHQGEKLGHFFSLIPDKMEWAVKALKRLDYEIDDATLGDIKGIAADLNEEKPFIQVAAKNKEVDAVDPKNKSKKIKRSVCNFYVNRKLESEDDDGDSK